MSVKKIRLLIVAISSLFILTPTTVFAGADSGFYIGAGIGNAPVEVLDFDENDFAFKVFGGYNFGVIPLLDLAVEAAYVDFGNPSTRSVSVGVTGVNAFGLAGLNFGPFGVFAKVGLVNWDADISFDTFKSSDSGTDPAYGIGARFQFGSLALRAEYELYDLGSSSDVSMLSVSAVFTF